MNLIKIKNLPEQNRHLFEYDVGWLTSSEIYRQVGWSVYYYNFIIMRRVRGLSSEYDLLNFSISITPLPQI